MSAADNPKLGQFVISIVALSDPLWGFGNVHFRGRTMRPNEWFNRDGWLYVNDPTLHPDHGGVGPIIGTKFRQNIFDPAFDGIFLD